MKKTKFVFVVLVYRNFLDLIECIDSIKEKVSDSQIVVVNAFYDQESEKQIETIAKTNGCHFLSIENKGYSFGNNRGIDYANEHFDYDYLVVCNPDITIDQFDEVSLDQGDRFSILAPKIIARNGKRQNPMAVNRNKTKEWLEYIAFTRQRKFPFYVAILLGKLTRFFAIFTHLGRKKPFKIYAAHGSFVIFRRDAIRALYPVYDEKMFLFGEEGVLAFRAKSKGLLSGQFNSVIIRHKEDGSMKLSNLRLNEEVAKGTVYYYENYALANSEGRQSRK